jgi:prepilin-type processing-associated H-X9-DG protein
MIPDIDQVKRRYLCFTGKTGQVLPAPMTPVMAYYMGMAKSISTHEDIEALFATQSYRKVFQCPADGDPPGHWTAHWANFYDDDILEPTSYGYNDFLSVNRFTKVWHPHEIAFFMDINATKERNRNQDFCFASWPGASFFDVWDNQMIPSNIALRPGEPWAKRRHGGRINIMFCDGHAQTFMLPPDDIRAHQGECGHVSMSRDVFGPDPPDMHLD